MDVTSIRDKYEQKIAELYEKTIEYYRVIEKMKTYIEPKKTNKKCKHL